ncbi:hypothetical protein [Mesorhizobium muleiense]|uniref:ATP-dependent DNA ligase n=1 Tax=Mesorhizobium muleiense TaxID=1004279 RepID=UPI0039B0A5C0
MPEFQALERELGNPNSKRIIFYAFDLLHLNGRDLRQKPLVKRKTALQKVLKRSGTDANLRRASGGDRQRCLRACLPNGPGGNRIKASRLALSLGRPA